MDPRVAYMDVGVLREQDAEAAKPDAEIAPDTSAFAT